MIGGYQRNEIMPIVDSRFTREHGNASNSSPAGIPCRVSVLGIKAAI